MHPQLPDPGATTTPNNLVVEGHSFPSNKTYHPLQYRAVLPPRRFFRANPGPWLACAKIALVIKVEVCCNK